MAPRPRLSLKARALGWLAQREHSRSELRRKLLRAARQAAAERQRAGEEASANALALALDPSISAPARSPQTPNTAEGGGVDPACSDPERCVDQLLDWLQARGYLNEARFVESRVHSRAARYGNLRIRQELAQHGVAADGALLQQLRDTEFDRAREVWRRKFGEPAADAAERARQMRFLAQRGFSAEVVRRVVKASDDEA
jgi:regulatory protein